MVNGGWVVSTITPHSLSQVDTVLPFLLRFARRNHVWGTSGAVGFLVRRVTRRMTTAWTGIVPRARRVAPACAPQANKRERAGIPLAWLRRWPGGLAAGATRLPEGGLDMATNLSWRDAAVRVLEAAGDPLHYTEIAQRILDSGLKASVGATPHDSLAAAISVSRNKEGAASPFQRHEAGVYGLRDTKSGPVDADANGPVSAIAAYGLFWDRAHVLWTSNPRVFGRQHPAADRVDLAGQHGVYALIDPRGDVVYVGQAKRLGPRLAQHTRNRLAARWSHFSWFGLRRVGADGKLADSNGAADPDALVDLIEGLLIEILEPRQNRQGGQWSGAEYLQAADPRL